MIKSLWLIFELQVEAVLSASPYVDCIVLHADPFHSYCVALVVASQSALEEWASRQGIAYSDFSELCRKEEAVKEVLSSLVKVYIFAVCIKLLQLLTLVVVWWLILFIFILKETFFYGLKCKKEIIELWSLQKNSLNFEVMNDFHELSS